VTLITLAKPNRLIHNLKRLTLAAFALPVSAVAETVELPTVTVSSYEESNHQILDALPEMHAGKSIVLERKDFIHQAQTLSEVLQTQAGIVVRQSSGLGSYASVNIRGSSSHQVMVYLDGVPLNSANGGGVNLNQIPLDAIEKVEIYLNQAPIQFASQYQGGGVNLVTHRTHGKPYTQLTAMKGSYGAQKLSLFNQNSHNLSGYKLSTLIQGTYQAADNDYSILNDNQTKYNPYDDKIEPRHNAQTEQKSLLGKIDYVLNATEQLSAELLYGDNLNHLPNLLNTPDNQAYLDTEQKTAKLSYQNQGVYQTSWIGQTNISFLQTALHYQDNLSQIGLEKQNNRYVTDSVQVQQYLENSYDLTPDWFLSWQNNLLWKEDRYHTRFLLDNSFLNNTTTERRRESLQYALALPLEHLSGWLITPSLTWQKFDDTPQNQQDSDAPIHETHTTWQLGTIYPITSQHQIKIRMGTAIRQPSFFEKYSDRGLMVGNPNLKKETSFQSEVGYRYQRQGTRFKKTLLELQAYQNTTKDIIIQSYDARGIGRSENLSQAWIQGIEAHGYLALSTQTELDLNFRHQTTQTQSTYSAYDSKQLPNLPEFTATAELKQSYHAWYFFYQYHFESAVYLDRSNLLTAPEKRLHNAGIRYAQPSWSIELQGHNLTDETISYFNGYPTPGSTYYLTFTLKL
jgi:iron complex outermembrane receptor protein